ncbi:hypothetical protein DL93DRAFT_1949831 [Clavulina sp. PMI_390]|nr:hypothetical protein DL93DRAFT_1949831 [Clavulina sp. PMI_390]
MARFPAGILSINFLTLGRDVWLEVLTHFEDPRDVLCLRMASRFFHNLSRERGTWKRILELQCMRNYVPLCTFPLNTMDRAQLELTAMRPYRFLNKLASGDPSCLKEGILRLRNADVPPTERISGLVSIPGGRFIFSASNSGTLVLWDLGAIVDPTAPQTITPKQFHVFESPSNWMWIWSLQAMPTNEEGKYRLVAVYSFETPEKFKAYGLIVDLRHPTAASGPIPSSQWELLGEADEMPFFHTTDGRYFSSRRARSVTVRDLFLDLECTFPLQCLDDYNNIRVVAVTVEPLSRSGYSFAHPFAPCFTQVPDVA